MTDRLVFNGINGSTGAYLIPPLTAHQVSQLAQGVGLDDEQIPELKHRHFGTQPNYAVQSGVNPNDLSQAGWGVIFPHGSDPAIRDALGELLAFRKEAAGTLFRVYDNGDAYRPGESKDDFLSRHGAGPGWVTPAKVPYYLLLVGDPDAIPFRFQYQLDVQYAVGRIHFDSLDEYARYARNVVESEQGAVRLPRRAAFFGVRNEGDRATQLSADELVTPLADELGAEHANWNVQTMIGEAATKARLSALLGGDETPALLFTASHGMGFDLKDPRHAGHQGALLCQEWLGPQAHRGRIDQECYLAAEDIGGEARLRGLITFHFACYGAGTPRLDDFAHLAYGKRAEIARQPFVARLPKRLLGHPRGGALAVIGHVERAWGTSFLWGRAGRQTETFRSTLTELMQGARVGAALEAFNSRYAELSSDLSMRLEDLRYAQTVDDLEISSLWTANNDARAYAVIGDPAVRLPLGDDGERDVERPDLGDVTPVSRHDAPSSASSSRPVHAQPGAVQTAEPAASPQLRSDFRYSPPGGEASSGSPADRIIERLEELAEELLRIVRGSGGALTVATYRASDLQTIMDAAEGSTERARLCLLTRIGAAGEVTSYVPDEPAEADGALWTLHSEMVGRAQAGRAEALRAAGAAFSSVLDSERHASPSPEAGRERPL